MTKIYSSAAQNFAFREVKIWHTSISSIPDFSRIHHVISTVLNPPWSDDSDWLASSYVVSSHNSNLWLPWFTSQWNVDLLPRVLLDRKLGSLQILAPRIFTSCLLANLPRDDPSNSQICCHLSYDNGWSWWFRNLGHRKVHSSISLQMVKVCAPYLYINSCWSMHSNPTV